MPARHAPGVVCHGYTVPVADTGFPCPDTISRSLYDTNGKAGQICRFLPTASVHSGAGEPVCECYHNHETVKILTIS